MKQNMNCWPALGAALCLQVAVAVGAAETNSPTAPASPAPLAVLTDQVLEHKEFAHLPPGLPSALELPPPSKPGSVPFVPEIECLDGNGNYNWIAGIPLPGQPRLVIAHSEALAEGLALNVYLTSASGVLEKAARRVNGGEFVRVPVEDVETEFQKQVIFWREWLAKQPKPTRKQSPQ
jgi:hypothetical protein